MDYKGLLIQQCTEAGLATPCYAHVRERDYPDMRWTTAVTLANGKSYMGAAVTKEEADQQAAHAALEELMRAIPTFAVPARSVKTHHHTLVLIDLDCAREECGLHATTFVNVRFHGFMRQNHPLLPNTAFMGSEPTMVRGAYPYTMDLAMSMALGDLLHKWCDGAQEIGERPAPLNLVLVSRDRDSSEAMLSLVRSAAPPFQLHTAHVADAKECYTHLLNLQ